MTNREFFHPDESDVAAHSYVKSVHNISVERSWRHLGDDWGASAVRAFLAGVNNGDYHEDDPHQRCVRLNGYAPPIFDPILCRELAQWLWPAILQRSLNAAASFRNGVKRRKDKKKEGGPNGLSRNDAFDNPEKWGGRNCLLPVDPSVVKATRDEIGDATILDFVSREFSKRAEAAFSKLGIQEATEANGWFVFKALFKELYPALYPKFYPD